MSQALGRREQQLLASIGDSLSDAAKALAEKLGNNEEVAAEIEEEKTEQRHAARRQAVLTGYPTIAEAFIEGALCFSYDDNGSVNFDDFLRRTLNCYNRINGTHQLPLTVEDLASCLAPTKDMSWWTPFGGNPSEKRTLLAKNIAELVQILVLARTGDREEEQP